MSFESHSAASKIFANKIAEPVVGYLTGSYQDKVANKFGNFNNLLTLKDQGGNDFEIVCVGTLGYLAKNLMMAQGVMPKNEKISAETIKRDTDLLGKMIRISPDGSYTNKAGKEIKKFKIEVDRTKTVDALQTFQDDDIEF
jgi:hypothetical protein